MGGGELGVRRLNKQYHVHCGRIVIMSKQPEMMVQLMICGLVNTYEQGYCISSRQLQFIIGKKVIWGMSNELYLDGYSLHQRHI